MKIKEFLKKCRLHLIKIASRILMIFPDENTWHTNYVIRGKLLRIQSANWEEHSRWQRLAKETKEPETINWIRKFNPKGTFLDIGACIGNYSIFAASLFPKMIIVAIEPEPFNFSSLLKNVKANRLNIQCFLLGLASKSEISLIEINQSLRGGGSGHQIKKFSNKNEVESLNFAIYTTSVDKLIFNKKIPVPNYIKIDVDGREKDIISGMVNLLKNKKLKEILIEINSKKDLDEIKKILTFHRFKCIEKPKEVVGNYIFAIDQASR